jgi:hypothetical protein
MSDTAAFEAMVTNLLPGPFVQRLLCMRGQKLDSCSKKSGY